MELMKQMEQFHRTGRRICARNARWQDNDAFGREVLMSEIREGDQQGHGGSDEQRQDLVDVTIGGKTVTLHRGSTPVSTIKEKGGVPAGYELALETPGTTPPFTPLADDARYTIKGGENFISYPKDSGSSGPAVAVSQVKRQQGSAT